MFPHKGYKDRFLQKREPGRYDVIEAGRRIGEIRRVETAEDMGWVAASNPSHVYDCDHRDYAVHAEAAAVSTQCWQEAERLKAQLKFKRITPGHYTVFSGDRQLGEILKSGNTHRTSWKVLNHEDLSYGETREDAAGYLAYAIARQDVYARYPEVKD